MKALLKQKVNEIFKLKRTYLLLLFVITMFSLSVLLEKYWRNYLKGYTVIFAIIIMVPVSYIYSLFLTEESKNTLIVFLKINKRKYKLYIFLILMLSLITTALLIVVLFISLKTFNSLLKIILVSILIGLFSSILTLMFKNIVRRVKHGPKKRSFKITQRKKRENRSY